MRQLALRVRTAVEQQQRHRSTAALALCVLGVVGSACTGSVVSGPEAPGDTLSLGAGTTDGLGGGAASPGQPGAVGNNASLSFQAAPAALRKLTVRQYQNSVRELFGADAELPAALESDTSLNGFFAIGAAKSTISPSAAEKFETAAYALATKALDAKHRAAFVGCSPTGAVDKTCTTDFVSRFGLRVFRRPLSSDEVTRYVGIAEKAQTTLGDFHAGLEYAVAGLLQSPSFLFRAELGSGASTGKSRAYDDYEMASRLSFLLWNSTPDSALLLAAGKGELTKLPGLTAEAERLLADPRARTALDDFHTERLSLDGLATLEKDKAVYEGLDDTLRGSMLGDVLDTIEEFTFGTNTDFRALFTTRVAFVESKLAALYGLPTTTTKGRVELPETTPRVGLLGKPAFLAANAHADVTSPTLRGKYVRERLLCQSIPAPPPNVVTVLPAPNPNAPTMRDRLKTHAESAACASCHTLMDPIGLSLEHFDAIGRYRADDKGAKLDTTGMLDGKSYDGEAELSALLHDSPRTAECAARQLYRYAVAHVETSGEQPAVDALIEEFVGSGYRFTALLRAVVVSDGFRFGAEGE